MTDIGPLLDGAQIISCCQCANEPESSFATWINASGAFLGAVGAGVSALFAFQANSSDAKKVLRENYDALYGNHLRSLLAQTRDIVNIIAKNILPSQLTPEASHVVQNKLKEFESGDLYSYCTQLSQVFLNSKLMDIHDVLETNLMAVNTAVNGQPLNWHAKANNFVEESIRQVMALEEENLRLRSSYKI